MTPLDPFFMLRVSAPAGAEGRGELLEPQRARVVVRIRGVEGGRREALLEIRADHRRIGEHAVAVGRVGFRTESGRAS
jgi:hypothetical protein